MSQDLNKDLPVFLDIERLIEKVKFGEVQISMGVHQGAIANTTVSSFLKTKYEIGDNSKAITNLLSPIKSIVDKGQTADITLTISIHSGNIREIVKQSYIRKVYNK